MSILSRTSSSLDPRQRREVAVFNASAVIAALAGAVALVTGVVGILTLG